MTNERKQEILKLYAKHRGRDLYHCYARFSIAKYNAWQYIWFEMAERGGKGLTIISYNSQMFTCAYEYTDSVTGERMLCYHTPTKVYTFPYYLTTPTSGL